MEAFLILATATIIYLIQAAVMDVKEKKIYSFPCIVLSILWSAYLIYSGERELYFLVSFWMIHISILTFFNKYHLWGAGDSDILLLFANVFLSFTGNLNAYAVAFYECMGVIGALGISLLVGCMEYRIRHKEMKITGNVAVAPGFSVIMSGLIAVMIGRCFW